MGRVTEKVYQDRKVQRVNGEYATLSIPPDVLEDNRFDIERGGTVSTVGIIESDGDTYLKIEGE